MTATRLLPSARYSRRLGLAHGGHAQQHDDARQGDDKKRQLPRKDGADQGQVHRPRFADQANHRAAGDHGQACAQVQAHGVNGDGPGQPLRREVVRHDRIGRRRKRRFANADPHPGHEQAREALRQPASGGHQAPQKDADGDDQPAAAPVGQPSDGHAEHAVEDGEREAGQQADLGVGNAEVAADGLHQQAQDLPVNEGHREGEGQNPNHVPRVGTGKSPHRNPAVATLALCHSGCPRPMRSRRDWVAEASTSPPLITTP